MKDCIFCNIEKERIIDKNEYFFVIRDIFPVAYFHTLIISNRCTSSYLDLTKEEHESLFELIKKHSDLLSQSDSSITGFNVGINIGEDAGQTIFHCHIHLIPRRKGDTDDPRGGVRGVIPLKQKY